MAADAHAGGAPQSSSVLSEDDRRYLDMAFDLAQEGRGRVHPNPMVGAVVVNHGRVVGRGAHLAPGLPHAEVVALRQAGEAARGSTLYCTLEPCAHQGRTPPCVDAIVAAGVARTVVALQDPNPLVDGRGLRGLRAAGIQVTVADGDVARRAAELNRAFLKYVRTGLPFVTYKAAVSLDGKVAAASGDARWLSGKESRALVHHWRSESDAVLIGAGTLRSDDPLLTVRAAAGRQPHRVVVTRRGGLPTRSRLFDSAEEGPVIVLAEQLASDEQRRLAERGVSLVTYTDGLRGALRALAARGLLDILCESGPRLFSGLLTAGLIDRLALFLTPVLMGSGAPELLISPAPTRVADGVRLEDVAWTAVGDDLLLQARPVVAGVA